MSKSKAPSQGGESTSSCPELQGILGNHPWLVFVLPIMVYMLLGACEPKLPDTVNIEDLSSVSEVELRTTTWFGYTISYRDYPMIYSIRLLITVVVLLLVSPGFRLFPWRLHPGSILIGAVGIVVWVVLCRLDLERRILEPFGLAGLLGFGERIAFNPLSMLASNTPWMVSFIAIRMVGMAVVVPLVEEFFLRGFLMRFIIAPEWWRIPFGNVNRSALVLATVYAVLTHPAEALAAAAWFTLITWWMLKTRNIWDCVVAHGVTNLLLGIYVLVWKDWALW